MTVITITPTWVKLLDFETTIPKAVQDLIDEKQATSLTADTTGPQAR